MDSPRLDKPGSGGQLVQPRLRRPRQGKDDLFLRRCLLKRLLQRSSQIADLFVEKQRLCGSLVRWPEQGTVNTTYHHTSCRCLPLRKCQIQRMPEPPTLISPRDVCKWHKSHQSLLVAREAGLSHAWPHSRTADQSQASGQHSGGTSPSKDPLLHPENRRPSPALRSVGKVESDQHRLPQEIAAVGADTGRTVGIVLGMQRQVGPGGMMDEVPHQKRM